MTVDEANAQFWDELCGTNMAQALGIVELNQDSLARFDAAYLDYYPYLTPLIDRAGPEDQRVLEIGLGFGTVTEYLARRARTIHAVDIAAGPVALARKRLEFAGVAPDGVIRGSALDLPFPDEAFDVVVSIGTLHHTGDLPRAIEEVGRVLRPGGRALVMVYNGHSFRRLVFLARGRIASLARRVRGTHEDLRAMYDRRTDGSVAPHTDFPSAGEVRRMFRRFTSVRVERRNFDQYAVGRGGRVLHRSWFLRGPDRILGLDLYISAIK